jgi:hypothetical protein
MPRDTRRFQLPARNCCLYLQGRSDKPWVLRWNYIGNDEEYALDKMGGYKNIQCKCVFIRRNDTLTSMLKYSL